MQTIAVDPYLLHFDEPCRSEADLHSFLEGLLSWSSAIRRNDTVVTLADAVKYALFQDDVYPHDRKVQSALAQYGVDEVDPKTIFGLTKMLIERSVDPEAITGINIVQYDPEQLSFIPELATSRLSPNTRPAYEQSLTAIGFHNIFGDDNVGFIIASRDTLGTASDSFPIRINCRIEEIDPPEISARAGIPTPFDLDEDVTAYKSFASLLGDLDSIDALQEPITVQSMKNVIQAKIAMHIANGIQEVTPEKTFSIGTQFIDSLRRYSFTRRKDLAEIVIDACARICLNEPRKPVLPFRETEDIHSEQLVRADGALAWRTHLTKHSAGYRLMLWTIGPNHFEFANVGPKKEEIIL